MKKTILLLIFVIISLSTVKGVMTDNLNVSYSFNGNGNDNLGYSNLTGSYTADVIEFGEQGAFFSGDTVVSPQPNIFDNWGAFTIAMWYNTSYTTTFAFYGLNNGAVESVQCQFVSGISKLRCVLNTATARYLDDFGNTTDWLDGDLHHFVYTYDGSFSKAYFDGQESYSAARTGNVDTIATDFNIGSLNGGTNPMTGTYYTFDVWDSALTQSNVTTLYNSGTILKYPFVAGGGDVTPPTITFENQTPSNLTNLNAIGGLIINYTITDITGVDTALMNFTLNRTEVYFNGVLQNNNKTFEANHTIADVHYFYRDEHEYLSGTYNIDPGLHEENPPLNDTIIGQNSWLKIQFYNVSNDKQQILMEAMFENATTPQVSELYYCNSNYSVGNPISSEWCVKFYEGFNNQAYNHTHPGGFSKHKIFPMGIDTTTGTIGNVYVTPISYILLRGNVLGERYYYISNTSRLTDLWETSNNNGNAWTDRSTDGVPNFHIHQWGYNESINYRVCANDTLSNLGCSDWISDVIDLAILPPADVIIYTPIEGEIYNISMVINHSQSISPSGQDIVSYHYEYKINYSDIWLDIDTNTYPGNTYAWDISNLLNGNYQIRINITDSLNLTTITTSSIFTVNNPLSVTDQLLTSILAEMETQTLLQRLIEGGIMIVGLALLSILFFVVGIWVQNLYLWTGSGLMNLLIGIYFTSQLATNDSLFNVTMAVVFYMVAIVISLAGVVLQIRNQFNNKEEYLGGY